RSVAVSDARKHVLGFTCSNDVTGWELTKNTTLDWLAGKCFDTFGVIGPWIATDLDGDDLALQAWVNGRQITDTHTSRMLWNTKEVVSCVSQFMTLYPGDVISCGSPPEYDAIKPGDEVTISIEGVGTLTNPVIEP